jgi:NADH-quinone oxidoreductase subunit N
VNFHQLIQGMCVDTLGVSLANFRPELALCATIVALLLVKMLDSGRRVPAFYVLLVGAAVALGSAAFWRLADAAALGPPAALFTGLLTFDPFSIYMRSLLLLFLILWAVLTRLSGVPAREDATDFYVLAAGATLGMCLMVSARHMLIVFLGVEMASVPSYALAGMLRGRRDSSEAALKFAIYGAATAGVMLYGISLLVGVLGSAHLPTMATQLAALLQSGSAGADRYLVLLLGGLMVMVGLAFKLSAVPFHFWAPDVFEGASAEVAALLSVASKAAALALLVRLALGLATSADAATMAALEPARQYITGLVALLAVVTCTFGNLAAYGQTNIKRLLAYSTIAHAGYMMMAVTAAVALAGRQPETSRAALAALAFYLGVYLFMNLGAFAVVAFLRNAIHSETIADYAGLIRRSPGLALCLAVILFSLVGLPPLAGFAGKFTIFAALVSPPLLAILVVGGLNTVLSLFYYLRVVKVIAMAAEPEAHPAPTIPLTSLPGLYCLLLTIPLVVWGVWWNGLYSWAAAAVSKFPG